MSDQNVTQGPPGPEGPEKAGPAWRLGAAGWRAVVSRAWWRAGRSWRQGSAGERGCLILASIMGGLTVVRYSMHSGTGIWPAWAGVVLSGVVWATAVAGASLLPMAGFALLGVWLAWQGITLMGVWAGTPLAGLPVMWFLAVGWRMAGGRNRLSGRLWRDWLIWLLMAGGAGYFLAGPCGWLRWLDPGAENRWLAKAVLGLGLATAGGLSAAWRKWRFRRAPGFTWVLVGGSAVMAAGLGLSALRDAEGTSGWAAAAVETSTGWLGIGWYWLAGGTAVLLVAGADGLSCLGRGRFRKGWIRWGFPVLWLMVTVLEWLPGRLFEVGGPAEGWGFTMWRAAGGAHFWVGVVVLTMGAGFLWQGKEGVALLPRLNALWLAAGAGLMMVLPGLGQSDAAGPPGWPGAIAGLGLVWMFRGIRPANRSGALLGMTAGSRAGLVVLTGLLLAASLPDPQKWGSEAAPAAVLGLTGLGLPLILFRWWTGHGTFSGGVNLPAAAGLTLGGGLSVLPMLHRNPQDLSQLVCCPLLWLTGLLLLRFRQPAVDSVSGVLAGALLGAGSAAAWCRPDLLLPEIPGIPWLNLPEAVAGGAAGTGSRPWLDPAYFTLLLLLTVAGAVLGWLVFRSRRGPAVPMLPLMVEPGDSGAAPSAAS